MADAPNKRLESRRTNEIEYQNMHRRIRQQREELSWLNQVICALKKDAVARAEQRNQRLVKRCQYLQTRMFAAEARVRELEAPNAE